MGVIIKFNNREAVDFPGDDWRVNDNGSLDLFKDEELCSSIAAGTWVYINKKDLDDE